MIVFKSYLKILNKNKAMIILYTIILLVISISNFNNSESSLSFESVKPDIYIIDNDKSVFSKSLVSYLAEKSNIVDIDNNEDSINDAIFYRDINYLINIPSNYYEDFVSGNDPSLEIKTTNDYNASLANMMVERYLKVANYYKGRASDDETLADYIKNALSSETDIQVNSELDTNSLSKMSIYFDFTNYSIIASLVFVICIIFNVFKGDMVRKRTIISSMNYKRFNRYLLLSNIALSFVMFLLYVLIALLLFKDTLFSLNGLICIINMFIFMICSTSFALLIANLIKNKEALSGIVNVVALGTSFLCGSFIPVEWLPDFVLKIAHIFPSYYYINSNNIAVTLEKFDISTLSPIIINNIIIVCFTACFVIITNFIARKKQKDN